MKVTVEAYSPLHMLKCRDENGDILIIDPYVGCALDHEITNNAVGRKYAVSDWWICSDGVWLCHGFDEIS